MKKSGILNSRLSGLIAALGHTDIFLIGDAGMPVPEGVEIVDLALCENIPTLEQTLKAVLSEAKIEYYYTADLIQEYNQKTYNLFQTELAGIPNEAMPHTDLKELTKKAKFAIRTGEFSYYGNIVLRAGVVF